MSQVQTMTPAAGYEAISVGVAPAAMAAVVVGRELDAAAAPRLADAIARALTRGQRHVLLDLTDVTFADASGLAFIIRAQRHLIGRGGGLSLIAAPSDIGRLLAVCGLSGAPTWAEHGAAVRWERLSPPSG